MRTRSVGGVLGCVLLTAATLFSCSQKSTGGSSNNGDASTDDSPYDASSPFGDDAVEEIVYTPFETGLQNDGGPCAMAPGTYSVTYTPTGGTADAAGCQGMTTTFVYPPPNFDGAGPSCSYAVSGNLPICSIDFNCSFDDGTYTTKNTGFIQVLDGSYGGQDEKTVFLDADAGFAVITCQYTLDYTKQ